MAPAAIRYALAVVVLGLCWALTLPQSVAAQTQHKIALWTLADGPHLRGAHLALRRSYPEIDGTEQAAAVLPGISAEDFREMAALGANAVVIAHPLPRDERPPYGFVAALQSSLDRLVSLAEAADLFVVIAARTGPGRSEFGFFADEAGSWFPVDLLNDRVWVDRAAQDAWVEGWRELAERYRGRKSVVGYELMLEPNSNHVGSHALNDRLGIWNPKAFHERYGGTTYDWNQLFPRIVSAIRAVDRDVPLLVGGNGYSSIGFLPYIDVLSDPKIVYVVHQYAPRRFTHQEPGDPAAYPGSFDIDGDGKPESVDRSTLQAVYAPVAKFINRHKASVAVTEFGAVRWAPGIGRFLEDQTAVMESLGLNHFFYMWDPVSLRGEDLPGYFYLRLGPDPADRAAVAASPQLNAVRSVWQGNSLRPSLFNVGQ